MSKSKMIEVNLVSLLPTPMGCGMFLSDGEKVILIYIDPATGVSMNDVLSGDKPERPQSHDFFYSFMQGMEVKMLGAHIVREKDEVFYASSIFQIENEVAAKQIVQIDCRPSDCISMALRFNIPIHFKEEVWDKQEDVSEFLGDLKDQIENGEEE